MDKSVILTQEMFEYNLWANQRVLQSLEAVPDDLYHKEIALPFSTIHKLLNHICYYDSKALQRVVHNIAEPIIEKELLRQVLSEQLQSNSLQWLSWIKQQKELTIEAANNLMLLNTHNTHHRGQLCIGINLIGHKMPSLDAYKFKDA